MGGVNLTTASLGLNLHDVESGLQCTRMAAHSRLFGRPGCHRPTQPSEGVRTAPHRTTAHYRNRLKFHKLRRNSVTIPVVHELVTAYDLFDQDDRIRVVVLTADPTAYAFCSGVRDVYPTSDGNVLSDDALLFYIRRIFLRVGRPFSMRKTSDRDGIVRAVH